MSFWRALGKHPVVAIGATYAATAALLFAWVESTMAISVLRLLVSALLAFAFPVVVALAWVLSGPSPLRRARTISRAALAAALLIWLRNTSLFVQRDVSPFFIAHRGVHQVFDPEHNDRFKCVGRIHPPEHTYIENTLPSIQAAFDHGARFVEVDIRETADRDFAVFHDFTLNCKTEAQGPVRDRTMTELRTLDVGYGYYTADGNHPLRGQGVGMMRSLNEVLDAFPGRALILDAKFGNDQVVWSRLIDYLRPRRTDDQRRLAVVGAAAGVDGLQQALPDVRVGSYARALLCARDYMILGWTGYVPASCHSAGVGATTDMGWLYWGWPAKFLNRLEEVNAFVILQPRRQTEEEFARAIPTEYTGGIQTDRIEKFRDWMSARTQ